MKYDVHIYAIVRVKVKDVEAESHAQAIEKAEASIDLNELFSTPNTEFADDIDGFLVDEVGDEDFRSSKQYEKDGVTPLQSLLCLRWIEGVIEFFFKPLGNCDGFGPKVVEQICSLELRKLSDAPGIETGIKPKVAKPFFRHNERW